MAGQPPGGRLGCALGGGRALPSPRLLRLPPSSPPPRSEGAPGCSPGPAPFTPGEVGWLLICGSQFVLSGERDSGLTGGTRHLGLLSFQKPLAFLAMRTRQGPRAWPIVKAQELAPLGRLNLLRANRLRAISAISLSRDPLGSCPSSLLPLHLPQGPVHLIAELWWLFCTPV